MESNLVEITTYLGKFWSEKFSADKAYERKKCFLCEQHIHESDNICLIPTRPQNNIEQEKYLDGQEYTVRVEPAHWTCMLELTKRKES